MPFIDCGTFFLLLAGHIFWWYLFTSKITISVFPIEQIFWESKSANNMAMVQHDWTPTMIIDLPNDELLFAMLSFLL